MTNKAIVVINAGSSSLKFAVFVQQPSGLELRLHGQLEALLSAPHFLAHNAQNQLIAQHTWATNAALSYDDALDYLLNFLASHAHGIELTAFGHRVVHGGLQYSQPVLINPDVLQALEQYVPLAPLHQPHNLTAIHAVAQRLPHLPQIACFDTAFHRSNPEIAQMFALPYALHEAGVRRYGFHGLSYEYIASVLPQFDPRASQGRTVVMHLGNGASMCALHQSRSVASSMGFTALDGLPMGTRSGNLDPGVLLYLLNERDLNAREIEKMLYQESGLLGVSGMSSDMRTLLASADPRAQLAIDLFVYCISRELGSLAAALGGVDALVFTAGIGENASLIRARVCQAAAWLGVELDKAANPTANETAKQNGAALITNNSSPVKAWVIPTNEELMIARHTQELMP